MSTTDKTSILPWLRAKDVRIAKLRIRLLHDNCKSNFEPSELREVRMILGTSTPLKSSQYHFTTEALYPVISKKRVPMILKELRRNSSFHSLESWSLEKKILKVSFVEKNEDSPMALVQPLGVLQYKEVSQHGVDNISLILHEINTGPIMDVLNLLGQVSIVSKYELDNNLVNLNYLLTEREEMVLEKAVSLGYFENPKKCYLKDIAILMGISIVATDKLLRSAERKIILSNYTK